MFFQVRLARVPIFDNAIHNCDVNLHILNGRNVEMRGSGLAKMMNMKAKPFAAHHKGNGCNSHERGPMPTRGTGPHLGCVRQQAHAQIDMAEGR